ncbi:MULTISPECIES: cytochrome b562 [Pseudoalteromonas]|uniref:cytochrome b562 n=1 Tax=Pseudoalteromonas TaxID=53246 RepID=UPI002354381E|nr:MULTISPECIES: cytochrome b562 [Pseudoalteromonas]MDN3409439.1 cytochrome b562 [Pseudoalteromonas sp. APC 3894]MDN3416725.1 cytochrome b562 [Pseudoalteromonas sp. APC 3227]MDN3420422.1 cytochrome b562 [Pseudoalteromonas sp. APC 3895]MDN3424116.1 cytochrome b562 [Pseudoalteromonas sp. APC 3896]|tara:strand:+ start:31696 stop:32085 length:390 start_codon:yes stop_codon:yes gene_type:complete
MKAVLLLIVLLFSQTVAANDVSDLEKTMKNIGLAYKQSVEATQLEEFNGAIDEFIGLIEQGKQAKFYKEAQKSVQGLDKVLVQAQLAKKVANEQGLEAAKKPLKAIDNLRKKYHELHEPPGFFELLFGK